MLRPELRWNYPPLKVSAFVLSLDWGTRLVNFFGDMFHGISTPALDCQERYIPGPKGGPDIRVRIFKPLNCTVPLPGMLYIHGGGITVGSPDLNLKMTRRFIEAEPCVIVSPHYRRSLEAPYPAALDDCYESLLWMKENAEELGMIPDRFIVAGHSAGGGLTAAVSLKVRDTKAVRIAFQMPIYPMLDDRMLTGSASDNNAPVWNSRANRYAWDRYLRDLQERRLPIPAYAAPARATDYTGLPPTISFVGGLEPFRDETVEYISRLKEAGVPVEFRVFEGCYHAFEVLAPKAAVSREAWHFLYDAFNRYLNLYFD